MDIHQAPSIEECKNRDFLQGVPDLNGHFILGGSVVYGLSDHPFKAWKQEETGSTITFIAAADALRTAGKVKLEDSLTGPLYEDEKNIEFNNDFTAAKLMPITL